MDRFANYENVIGAVDLTGKEGYAIDFGDNLTVAGGKVKGIIIKGFGIGLPSVIQTRGECKAIINAATTNVAIGDNLIGSAAAGIPVKGTGDRCIALEPATTDAATIKVRLI